MVSAVASVTAIFVGAATLIFLWFQLRANREAIKAATASASAAAEAARIAAADVRPWLRVKPSEFADIETRLGRTWVRFDLTIENIGRTPALAFSCASQLFAFNNEDGIREFLSCADTNFAQTLFPGDAGIRALECHMESPAHHMIAVRVGYNIYGDDIRHFTSELYSFLSLAEDDVDFGVAIKSGRRRIKSSMNVASRFAAS